MVGARFLLPAALGDSEPGRCLTLNVCQKQARLDSEHSKSLWVPSKTKNVLARRFSSKWTKEIRASLVAQKVKNPPAMQEIWVRSLDGEDTLEKNGNPLQYSCLKNSMDRRAWWATVHGVTKSQTRLK